MTPVVEQEKVKIDINIDEESGNSMDMIWEVETEPAHYEQPRTRQYAPAAKTFNKHLFTWLFAFLLGGYGVDRFVRGQIGLGILKLFTGGCFGILYMADLLIAIYKSYLGEFECEEELSFDDEGNYIY